MSMTQTYKLPKTITSSIPFHGITQTDKVPSYAIYGEMGTPATPMQGVFTY